MTYPITVELSEPMYRKLLRIAELAQQPMDAIVEQSLEHSLSPLLEDDIPPEFQAGVYPLLDMTVDELQTEVKRRFPAPEWVKYEDLLEKKKTPLSEQERERLDASRKRFSLIGQGGDVRVGV